MSELAADLSPEPMRLERCAARVLRFFEGLSLRQAAAVLGISPTTADRHRAWLYNELRQEE